MTDLPPATIEFLCGKTVSEIGMITMALNAHLNECTNAECVADVRTELAKLQ